MPPPSDLSGPLENEPMTESSTIGKPTPHSSGTTSRASSLASVTVRLAKAERWLFFAGLLAGSAAMAVMLLLLSILW